MARYFKFHSLEDIRDAANRLALNLRFSDDLSPLFRPVDVGPFRTGNSLCIQPMEGCDGTLDGRPDELTFRRYRRFGAGGAKLIWGEACAISEEARATPRQLLIDEATAPDLERMLAGCRQAHRDAIGDDADLVVGLQLTHSGRYSYRRPLIVSRDPLLVARTRSDARVLEDDDLARLVDQYVAAARLARRCGFDFVDVKQCHRYLLNELLGARSREGRYGGCFENRTRLATEIIQAIRAEVPGLLIACRLNLYDGIPYRPGPDTESPGEPIEWAGKLDQTWGTSLTDPFTPDLAEPIAWVGRMHELGLGLLNTSLGNPYSSPHLLRPFEVPPPDGYHTPEHPLIGVDRHFRLTADVQRAFPDLPIVGSGYSYLQEYLPQAGAANLRDGRVMFVGVGRASFSMPDFATQLREHGTLDRRRICRTFSYCTALMRAKHNEQGQFASGCPPFDKEVYGPLWDLARKKE